MTVTVKKVGGSVAVVIPKAVAQELELSAGTPLDISTADGAIVMRKRHSRRPRRSMTELVKQMNAAAYRRNSKEFPDSGPVGKEIW